MATFNQTKEVRLTISDPSGFINFIEIATLSSIPGSYPSQTGYKTIDSGNYYSADKELQELRISDDRIDVWIDANGINYAIYKSIEQILNQIGQELFIVSSTGGAESVQFVALKDLQSYYESLLERYKNKSATNKTGRWAKAAAIQVAGGEV